MANSLTATIAKVPDGDISFGSKNAEVVTLSDAPSSYPTGGYPFIAQAAYNNAVITNPSTPGVNVDLWKIDTVQPWGSQLGLNPVWNPTYQKLQLFSGANELASGTDVSGYVFELCVIGT